MQYPDHLNKLIDLFKKFPGVGAKSAERIAFQLIGWSEESIAQLSEVIGETKVKLTHCETCGALIEDECTFCKREAKTLCVISSARDIFLIEETRQFSGLYHVLGNMLSPIAGLVPSKQVVDKLKDRVITKEISEVIIALDSTLEGDATALYLKKELAPLQIKVSRLAFGIPMGSSLDFIDGGTLSRALIGRSTY
ncbi:MAG: Recombination protein RecR [Chlamydiales bacterium]|nr:Recombination protein RecR [Chlamydiales bacterium]MCH9620143.1 Recombination protein RecR [Chlamydiales bacterium]MCH9623613.1 Recombination protein RecR [Chlamydiales bacterium]